MRRSALVLIVCAACEGEPSAPPAPTANVTAVPATAAPRSTIEAPGAGYADEDVPVAEDFEEEAEKAVTEENYKSELARLESEIGGVDHADDEPEGPADKAKTKPPEGGTPAAAPPPAP